MIGRKMKESTDDVIAPTKARTGIKFGIRNDIITAKKKIINFTALMMMMLDLIFRIHVSKTNEQ